MKKKMLKTTRKFIKTGLIMTSFGLITSNAFCGGAITGSINTDFIKSKGDVVVYLKGVKGTVTPKQVTVDQRNFTFIPKVTAISAGSTVVFTNHDNIYHNINSKSPAKLFSIDTYDPGTPHPVTFEKSGEVQLLCKVHPEMSGWVIVTDNQYAAVTEHDGKFSISDIPEGTYEIAIWSEKLKLQNKTTVTVAEGKTASVVLQMSN